MNATHYATTTNHAIVACIEYLRGLAIQARAEGQIVQASLFDRTANGMWNERGRIAKEVKAAFGTESVATTEASSA